MGIDKDTRTQGHKDTGKGLGKIGVLMGGTSTEREISLKSGHAVFEALREAGVDALAVDIRSENQDEIIRLLEPLKIDCAFLALHGRFGEDGQIQRLLEKMGIPYTGSGAKASELAMDKAASRSIFAAHGLSVPKYRVVDKVSYKKGFELNGSLSLPLVVKPVNQGSSIGLSLVREEAKVKEAVDLAFGFDTRVMIEEFIEGRELTVGILNDKPLPVIEIIPKNPFFDYEAKYQAGMTDYVVPAKLEEEVVLKTGQIALSAHRLLGCAGCSRVDMILNLKYEPVVLEVNTIPGLTSTSLLPKAAKSVGIEFHELCCRLIKLAYEKE
jgi:D-alanine-D-alanine ligase